MIVCEKRFEFEDPDIPGYSMLEINVYATVPTGRPENKDIISHNLALRKNLTTGEYELYAHYSRYMNMPDKVVAATKDLHLILKNANDIWNRFWGDDEYQRETDTVCTHKHIGGDWMCPDLRRD